LKIALRLQQQYPLLNLQKQQQLTTLLTALQLQNDQLNRLQLQQLDALLLWQQQQQNAAVVQLNAFQVPLGR
jgi:hypothetical protein